MEYMIEIFSALGERLRRFGDDATTREVIAAACRANDWFTPDEVCRALRALATELLQPEPLRQWLADYPRRVGEPRRILVVMAGNIPAVGFFDLLCVVCSGHRCAYKPSGKDSVLMDYIVAELLALAPDIPVERYDGTSSVNAVIATGNDNTERYFKARYVGLPMLLRGSRQSVAVLSGRETAGQRAGLSDDIWAYSGLGCRNVSLIFVPENYELTLEMKTVTGKYKNNYRQTKSLLRMNGISYRDFGGAVAVEQWNFPKSLCELAVARYRTLDEVAAWLAEHDREIQCVVTDCLPHERRADFGRAQSPGLTDWPDGRNVLAWLTTLA
ncbi:MAG: acyl-CoA reductase [Alistipes senegalensis]|nr:acyl-CoA reductase [Bacteroides cellulosilyticus]MCM1352047.1 acyl-CoA reductase [Alistipes senegalensis]